MNFWFYRQEFLLLRFGINNWKPVHSCNMPCANPSLLCTSPPPPSYPCSMPQCPTAWRHLSLSQHCAVSLSNFLTVINLPATWIRQAEGEWEANGGRAKHRNIFFYFFFSSTFPHHAVLFTLCFLFISRITFARCAAREESVKRNGNQLSVCVCFCVCVCVGHCSDRCRTRQQDVQDWSPSSLPHADWLLGCPLCWFLMQSKSKSKAMAMFVSHSTRGYPV